MNVINIVKWIRNIRNGKINYKYKNDFMKDNRKYKRSRKYGAFNKHELK